MVQVCGVLPLGEGSSYLFHGELFDVNHCEDFFSTETRSLLTTTLSLLNDGSMSQNAFISGEIQVPSHVKVEYGVSQLGEPEEKWMKPGRSSEWPVNLRSLLYTMIIGIFEAILMISTAPCR